MARIVLASWMVRYPLGGILSWGLQQLLGYKDLGHDVYLMEKHGYENACFDPIRKEMTNDCSYGVKQVSELLFRFGLEKNWCFIDHENNYHGLNKLAVDEIFKTADLFIDVAPDGSWIQEASHASLRVLIDGEPGYSQIVTAKRMEKGEAINLNEYDRYYTNGKNIGSQGNPVPTLGLTWGHVYTPVKSKLFNANGLKPTNGYSTIMNWQSHKPIEYNGKTFGQKDIEFEKFISLPTKAKASMEIAVTGKVPEQTLRDNGWNLKNGHLVTETFDSFRNYIWASKGEFSVCKNVFVENNTGWFSDKSAAYLASKRPVVLQDTGFKKHLPVGEGLFAVNTQDEAAAAIEEIERNYEKHSLAAYEIAHAYLETSKVLGTFLKELGI